MGMFDEIECEYPLPECPDGVTRFQTKDLKCHMDTYTINAEGRLIHHYREMEATPDELMPPRTGTWRDAFGCMRVKPGSEKKVDTNHHGYLRFYTGAGDREAGTYQWLEYLAKFTDGTIVRVERLGERQ